MKAGIKKLSKLRENDINIRNKLYFQSSFRFFDFFPEPTKVFKSEGIHVLL